MIYCVEDDAGIRDIEVYTLQSTGYVAAGFPDGDSFFAALKKELPELILLDVMLPGQDGIAILRQLKSDPSTRNIPVIMATAKGAEYDKIMTLDLGADDYLVKPFGMMEMVSRVRAVLRRCAPKDAQKILTLNGLTINLNEHTVTAQGSRVVLTNKEFQLLYTLMSRPGMVFTRDQLLADVWGTDFGGETRTVDVHIRTLRQKLGNCGKLIDTVRGVGYRMEAQTI